MRGPGDPSGDRDPPGEPRRTTPPLGVALDVEPLALDDTANEDFLFHLYRGSELLQDNRVHEAKEELERALCLQPGDTKGQDLLGIVYFRLGQYPRAIALYEQLRYSSPRDPALLVNLALCYLKTGQPSLARRDLEELVAHHPTHTRAWGYLGLACERLGDLEGARSAFERGGHTPLAARIADRVPATEPPTPADDATPSAEARVAVAAAFEELDAGELSFALAEPARGETAGSGEAWQAVELGRTPTLPNRAASLQPATVSPGPESTRAPVPQLGGPASLQHRRPTLIAPAGPAAGNDQLEATLDRYPSPNPPMFDGEAVGVPSLGLPPSRAFVVPSPMISATGEPPAEPTGRRTLSPAARRQTAPLPPASQLTRDSVAPFPDQGEVVLHASGVALVRTGDAGFVARLEAMRAATSTFDVKVLERRTAGRGTTEPFGGAASPIALVAGEGQLVLGPRAGRTLSSFLLEGDPCFVREDVLLGFDARLVFEHGRLAGGDGEHLTVVQLRGSGAVLLEAMGSVLTLEVAEKRGLTLRREAVLGWFGRLVPRPLPAAEAPGGLRGLLGFAGEGSVLLATA